MLDISTVDHLNVDTINFWAIDHLEKIGIEKPTEEQVEWMENILRVSKFLNHFI